MKRLVALAAFALLVATVAGVAYAVENRPDGSVVSPVESQSGPPLDRLTAYVQAYQANPQAVGDLTTYRSKQIPGRAFGFDFGEGTDSFGNCAYQTTFTANILSAPVELPVGARVTSFAAHFDDLDTMEDVSVNLRRTTQVDTDPEFSELLGSASSSGASGNQEVSATVSATVGQNEFWYLDLVGSDGNERLCGVEIFYSVASTNADLVFTPVTPCVVYDSRPGQGGTGAFAAGETRTFSLIGPTTDLSGQGGSATGCGIPGTTGICAIACSKETKAVAVNIVAIGPSGPGQAKMWPADEAEPAQGALVNYIPGGNNSNATIVGIGQCTGVLPSVCGDDLSVRSLVSSTNIRVVVTGYFTYAGYISD